MAIRTRFRPRPRRSRLRHAPIVGSLALLACAGTLEDRAKSGNAMAQRQLGESFLSQPVEAETPRARPDPVPEQPSAREREGAYWIRLAAKQGDARAQHRLAELYYRGQGVERNYAQAARWSQSAAEQGDAEAQGFLAGLYRIGRGVPPNLEESLAWYRKAAEQGHASSQYHIGAAYDFGTGLPADRGQALIWYTRAADQGHHEAQYNLAVLYLTGDRADPSPPHGLKWLFIGSRTGSSQANEKLLQVQQVYRPEDFKQGFLMAREWLAARGIGYPDPESGPRDGGTGGAADGI